MAEPGEKATPGILEELGISLAVSEPVQELVYNVGRVYTQINRLLSITLKAHGLTVAQFNTMALCRYTNGLSQTELGRRLFVSGANITGLVDRLQKQRMVRREQDAADRRRWIIRLTPSGEKKLDEVWPVYEQRMKDSTAGLDAEQVAGLLHLLSLWRRNLAEQR